MTSVRNAFPLIALVLSAAPVAAHHELSLQFGVSHERTWRKEVAGVPRHDTGGWALMAHPTVVVAVGTRTLLHLTASAPLADEWRNPNDRERFRVGAGTVVRFGS